jgi:hypothetical protein
MNSFSGDSDRIACLSCKSVVKSPPAVQRARKLAAVRAKNRLAVQTILVIDDDDNLRDTIGVLMEREGFRAILAADGLTGLDQAILVAERRRSSIYVSPSPVPRSLTVSAPK